MTKKNNHQSAGDSLNFGEIGTIRDILMGKQMTEIESRFAAMEEKLTSLESNLGTQTKETEILSAKLDKDFGERIVALEAKLTQSLQSLNTQIKQASQNDKALIGKILSEMGDKLMQG